MRNEGEFIEENTTGLRFVAGAHLTPCVCGTDLGQSFKERVESRGAFAVAPNDKALNAAVLLESLPDGANLARVLVRAGEKSGDLVVAIVELACFEGAAGIDCRGADFDCLAAGTGITKGSFVVG